MWKMAIGNRRLVWVEYNFWGVEVSFVSLPFPRLEKPKLIMQKTAEYICKIKAVTNFADFALLRRVQNLDCLYTECDFLKCRIKDCSWS